MPDDDEREGESEEGDLVIELGEGGVPTMVTQPASPMGDTPKPALSLSSQEDGNPIREVTLRADRGPRDDHYLTASLDAEGSLVLAEPDLGPGTAMVSSDGEYEYWITVKPEHFPTLLAMLEGDLEADLLEALSERWIGKNSYEPETLILNRVPHGSHSYH